MYIFRFIVGSVVEAFSLALLVYCVSSWFIRDPFNKFMRVMSAIVDPVLNPIRRVLRLIPFVANLPIDFSPIVAFFLIQMVLSLI